MAVPPPADADSLSSLLALVSRGETAALARLVRMRHEPLTRLALGITLDLDLAAAAVSEAWTVAWRDLQGGPVPLDGDAWLARRVAAEARLLAERGPVPPEPPGLSSSSAASRRDPAAGSAPDPAVGAALASLAPADRVRLALGHLGPVGIEPAGFAPAGRGLAGAAGIRGALGVALARRARAHVARLEASVSPTDLRAWVSTARIRPVNADEAARRATVELRLERNRRLSVVIGAIAGILVATAPLLLPLLAGR